MWDIFGCLILHTPTGVRNQARRTKEKEKCTCVLLHGFCFLGECGFCFSDPLHSFSSFFLGVRSSSFLDFFLFLLLFTLGIIFILLLFSLFAQQSTV